LHVIYLCLSTYCESEGTEEESVLSLVNLNELDIVYLFQLFRQMNEDILHGALLVVDNEKMIQIYMWDCDMRPVQ
jgi:hypothetical protein